MPYIGNPPAEKYAAFNVQHFTTSATTSYTLTHAVADELDIRLVLNNVVQQPGASYAYTASATTLTLSVATTGTDTMYAVYIGKAVQTVTPGANSVGTTALQDNSVTEAKLNVSNSPTNGYVLSAQSAAAGGLTWAADAAGTITAFTNGVDNRVVTATSATALNGEPNLTWNGTFLGVGDSADLGSGVHIKVSDTGASVNSSADELIIERSGDNGMTFLNSVSGESFINFGDSGDNDIGQMSYHHSYNSMAFKTNAVERMRIDSAGKVGIGTSTMTRTLNVTDTTASASTGIQLTGANDGTQFITFGDTDDANVGEITYDHSLNKMLFRTNDVNRMFIDNAGKVGIGVNPTLALDISSTDPRIYMIDTTSAGSTYKTKFGQYNDTFLISTNDGANDAIKIYATGEVTTPLNPAFRIYQSTQTTYATGHTMYNQNITEEYDVNGDMGTNGSFTAPVTGKYIFGMSYYDVTASENQQYYMEFISSNRSYRWANINYYRAGYTGASGNMKGEGTLIVDMDANDTAYVKCGSSGNVDNGNNAQNAYYSGILIG